MFWLIFVINLKYEVVADSSKATDNQTNVKMLPAILIPFKNLFKELTGVFFCLHGVIVMCN